MNRYGATLASALSYPLIEALLDLTVCVEQSSHVGHLRIQL